MKLSKGFTLIELIVVMAVFLFIIGAAISIFISIVQHQKKIMSEQQLLSQTSYALEYMSKGLRMAKKSAGAAGECGIPSGYIYLLTKPNNGFYTGIKFINQSDNNACQEFFLDNSVLKEIKNGLPLGGTALSSTNLNINSIRFGINGHNGCHGAGCVDGAKWLANPVQPQPRVTIYLDIKAQGDSNQPIKKIQTTVSQRDINVE
jgi:prepilin-type N-terminal cleavage/methylation domain-containing protein